MAGRSRVDFTNGPMLGNIIIYIYPILLGEIFQRLFNTADMMVVGKFVGDTAQAAVSATGTLCNLMTCILSGLGAGVNVLVARYVGAKDREKAQQVLHTSVAAALSLGSLLAVLCIFLTPYALQWMNFSRTIAGQARIYMSIYFTGVPIQLTYQFCAGTLRAQGDSKRPTRYLMLGGVVNVVLNLITVLVFHWGVAGVALATVASNLLAAVLTVRCLTRGETLVCLEFRRLRIRWSVLGGIARIGIPSAITTSMFNLSSILLQSGLNTLGDTVVAGVGATTNLFSYVSAIQSTISNTIIVLCAQNLGARRIDRVKRGQRICAALAVGCTMLFGALLLVFGPWVLRMYTNDPAVVREGMVRLYCAAPFYWLYALTASAGDAQKALGGAGRCAVVSLFGTCGLRLIWLWFVFPLNPTNAVLSLSFPVSWAITGAIQLLNLRGLIRMQEQKLRSEQV